MRGKRLAALAIGLLAVALAHSPTRLVLVRP